MCSEITVNNCHEWCQIAKIWNLNRKSWSPTENDRGTCLLSHSRLTWFCACADSCVVFNTYPHTILGDNLIYLDQIAVQVDHRIAKSGSAISNIFQKNLPPAHRIRNMVHAQCLQMHSQLYPVGNIRTHAAQKCLVYWIVVLWRRNVCT